MKKFKFEDYFGWPSDKIIQFFIDNVDLVPQETLDGVKAKKELVNRREGKKIYYKSEWCVHGQIPKVAQKIVSPEKLTFVEHTVWDDDTAEFHTKIEPHFFRNILICETSAKYWDAGDGGTKRYFKGKINVKLPVIGSIVEKAIIDGLKENNQQNFELMLVELEKRLGPEQKNGKKPARKHKK